MMKSVGFLAFALSMIVFGCGGGGEDDTSSSGGTGVAAGGVGSIDFATLNSDGDEKLNEIEWASSGAEAQMFVDFDSNSDGFIDESELSEAKAAEDTYTACDPASCGSAAIGGACMINSCQGGKGECVSQTDTAGLGLPCDDGDLCTSAEYCQDDGTCSIFGDGKSGTEFCLFDTLEQGKDLGNHVKNFGMKAHDSCPYWMHQNCGTDKKVIWMILGTGW